MVDNVYFSLENTARLWFENNEHLAEDPLRIQNKQPNYTVRSLIKGVLQPLVRADTNATAEQKITFLIRVVKEVICNTMI